MYLSVLIYGTGTVMACPIYILGAERTVGEEAFYRPNLSRLQYTHREEVGKNMRREIRHNNEPVIYAALQENLRAA